MPPRRLIVAALAASACLIAAAPAAGDPLINEIMVSPPNNSVQEYVELRAAPGESLADTYLVVVDGDAPDLGDVRMVFDLTADTAGTNGFLVLLQQGHPYTPDAAATTRVAAPGPGWAGLGGFSADGGTDTIQSTSTTFLLVRTTTAPTTADDIDGDGDGVADGATYAGWTVLDGIGILDNQDTDAAYSPTTIRDADSSAPAPGTIVDVPWTAGYVGRAGGATGSTAADWLATIPAGTAPNFTLSPQFTWIPQAAGRPLDHLGRPNRSAPPNATTGAPGAIGDTQAELAGTVTLRGTPTSWFIEYGPTAEYGSRTPVQDAGDGVADVNVRATIGDLTPGTLYHYRVVAENGDGTAAGGDRTFVTTGTAPRPPAETIVVPPVTVVVTPPTVVATASLTRRRYLVRRRIVALTVRCGRRRACRGTLVLRARRGARTFTVGFSPISIPAGAVRTVRVRIGPTSRRLLRRRRTLRATATFHLADRSPLETAITLVRARRRR